MQWSVHKYSTKKQKTKKKVDSVPHTGIKTEHRINYTFFPVICTTRSLACLFAYLLALVTC